MGNRQKFHIGNGGMSLVEIIIAIAILSVLIGVVSYGINFASGKAAEECAQKITSCLQQARTATMGKNRTTITIRVDASTGEIVADLKITPNVVADDGTVSVGTETVTSTIVGNNRVDVQFTDGSGFVPLDAAGVTFEFDRASGALKLLDNDDASHKAPQFMVSKGSTKRTIEIVPITGRIAIINP